MAATSTKKSKRGSKKDAGRSLVPAQRKREVLGLILMVAALLLTLALLTYAPSDDAGLVGVSFIDLLLGVNVGATNALGSVGAAIARVLVPGFLGYTSLILPLLLALWGYAIFRGPRGGSQSRLRLYLPLYTVLGPVVAFVLASLFGWLGHTLQADLLLWSGAFGQTFSAWMQRVFGTPGSLILLLLLLTVSILFVIDHDVQRTLDRLENGLATLWNKVASWWTALRERQATRRAERAQLREKRQAAREADRLAAAEAKTSPAAKTSAPAPGRTAPSKSAQPEPKAASEPNGDGYQRVNDLYRGASPRPAATSPPESEPAADRAPSPQPERLERPAPPRPAPKPSPKPQPAREEHHGVEMKVQEQIREEKADAIVHAEDEVPATEVPYQFPDIDLLDVDESDGPTIDYDELEQNKAILLDKLETYNIEITDVNAIVGPTVTLYELTPAPGVKISRITAREDDLAMAMAAPGIRIIAPIPGKSAVGVEIPNRHRELVRIRDVIGTAKFNDADMELPVALGKSIEGEVYIRDLAKMPHLLIAGATGSGKSVGLNGIIVSLLYACHPANLKFVIIDPKKIELQQYEQLYDHYLALFPGTEDAIITDFEEAMGVLKSAEKEMERRYDLLSKASVRNLKEYNRKVRDGKLDPDEEHEHLPYIVVVVDELADLMMTAGKDIEAPIARLAQMARAVGIHLILATQRPSVDVITGLIKANFPARMAFQVASRVDSRTILDQIGAQGLVGNGDLLYQAGSHLIRLQGPFVSIEEIDRIMDFIAGQPGTGAFMLPELEDPSDVDLDDVLASTDRDDLFEQAAHLIVRAQQGSVSLLQRKLSVGYTRAARIVDQLEDAGIVGPFEGSKARQVLVPDEAALEEAFNADKEE